MEPVPRAEHRKFLTPPMKPVRAMTPVMLALGLFAVVASAQQNRITRTIDNADRTTLTGHLHPGATAENDRGRVVPTLQLSWVTLTLAQAASQKADLNQFLADLQNPRSANYHHWLTPEQYADRFGLSQDDLTQITSWLQGQGLTIAYVARGRSWVAVNGSAAQVEAAFQTEIHEYQVNGETHFANATEPSVPAALGSVVAGIRGLNDFRMKPHKSRTRYTSGSLCGGNCVAPADLATIYDISPAYSAGIDGTGQKIAIAGQTDVILSDIQQFRSNYGLPSNLPTPILIPNSRDPGLINTVADDELAEADLDLEWSGAVARNATIFYVYATDVMQAVLYAIDSNLAPVVSTSYGNCEQETDPSELASFQTWAQQGNAQGITWFNASGDDGAADCNDAKNPGLAVDAPASVPEVTGIGGTEFVEGGATYWSATNNPVTGESALSYIPETAWNDSVEDGTPSASGGGSSVVFAKPSWQTGPGVPADNARHVPDLAMNASADHDGYLVYTTDPMDGPSTQVYGGTSVPTPIFAGIGALINQYLIANGKQASPGLGNINPQLYALAPASSGIFHDITTGNNIVSPSGCSGRIRTCSPVGYDAGPGYDPVTGWGSVDVWNLITGWSGSATVIAPPPTVSLSLVSNLLSLDSTNQTLLIATATGNTGVTPVGAVTFVSGSTSLGSATLMGSGGTATATLSVSGGQLGGVVGAYTVTATYNGSSSAVSATVNLSVRATSASNGTPSISGLTNAGSFKQVYAPGMILSIFGSTLAPGISSASSVPFPLTTEGIAATINGEAVPLWYVSAGQLNVQIPYEAIPGPTTLTINNNGVVTSQTFAVAATAPGIFTNSSGVISNGLPGATRGKITTLYLTGAGAVSPAIATGAAPAANTALSALPAPTATTTMTVGGAQVATPFEFIGIPSGLVGVTQLNFQVPSGIPTGNVPVVVTIGGASATAYLNVAN